MAPMCGRRPRAATLRCAMRAPLGVEARRGQVADGSHAPRLPGVRDGSSTLGSLVLKRTSGGPDAQRFQGAAARKRAGDRSPLVNSSRRLTPMGRDGELSWKEVATGRPPAPRARPTTAAPVIADMGAACGTRGQRPLVAGQRAWTPSRPRAATAAEPRLVAIAPAACVGPRRRDNDARSRHGSIAQDRSGTGSAWWRS